MRTAAKTGLRLFCFPLHLGLKYPHFQILALPSLLSYAWWSSSTIFFCFLSPFWGDIFRPNIYPFSCCLFFAYDSVIFQSQIRWLFSDLLGVSPCAHLAELNLLLVILAASLTMDTGCQVPVVRVFPVLVTWTLTPLAPWAAGIQGGGGIISGPCCLPTIPFFLLVGGRAIQESIIALSYFYNIFIEV